MLRLLPILSLLPRAAWGVESPSGKEAVVPALNSGMGAGQVFQVVLALVAILLFILLLAWLLRRVGQLPFAGNGAIRILAGVSLGQRERAVLVQVGETQLLLGIAPGRVQTLHVLDRPIASPATVAAGERFAEKLAAVLKRDRMDKP